MIPPRRSHLLIATLALALAGCSSPNLHAAAPGSDADLALYRSVLERVRTSYVDPVGDGRLIDNSLKGMLTGLDPHSDYMSEQEYQEMLDDSAGEFAGIGAELSRDDNHPVVISPIDDTPAARAGIQPGDIILRIDGQVTDGMSLKDVVGALRGPADTAVRITIGRKSEPPFEVTLTRAIIKVDSVKSALEPNGIGYVRITNFAETTQRELTRAIDDLKTKSGGHLQGFVLDLRNDPGGLLDQAVRVAGDFLDGGTTVSIRGRSPDDNRVFPAPTNGDRIKGVPMAVLINGASASAAEIVAGALQDRQRAELLGTQSFGKGSVQTIIPLDGHGALRLTTARYYTPSGRSIQGTGIIPDRVVEQPKTAKTAEAEIVREADLPGALGTTAGVKDSGAATASSSVQTETIIEFERDRQRSRLPAPGGARRAYAPAGSNIGQPVACFACRRVSYSAIRNRARAWFAAVNSLGTPMTRALCRLLLPIMLSLASCAPAPQGPVVSGPLPPSPPGTARLIFYRALTLYDSTAMTTVFLNGAPVGVSQVGTLFYRDVPPGRYDITVFSTRTYPNQFKTVVVAPGDVYFARIDTLPKLACTLAMADPCTNDTFIVTLVDPAAGVVEDQGLRLISG